MDFDLDLMETSIDDNNEVSSLEQTYENNNRILEAVLVADKLEQQYRMQGYSEAQIQQFHEKFMDKVKGAVNKLNPFRKKETAMDKVKGAANNAWEWVKKMVAKFVTFCKKVWLKISSLFTSDEKLLEKYKNELGRLKGVVAKIPDLEKSVILRLPITFKFMTPVETYKKAARQFDDAAIVYKEIPVNYFILKRYLSSINKQTSVQDHIKKAIQVQKSSKNADSDKTRAYIAYLNASLRANIKLQKAAHSAIREALIKGIAKARKLNTNESAQILEQQITEVQYMYESLIDENNRSIMPLIEQVEV